MKLGYDRPLFILAFDHRGSFSKGLFGLKVDPTPEEMERIIDSKRVIYDGLQRAVASGAGGEDAGMLVDEQFGADVAREGRAAGLVLAMPVEKSGQSEFDFEYGDEFGKHIEDFDPKFSKVLVRYNPEGEAELNKRQAVRLAELSAWLRDNDRRFLFELLVPAEPGQLERVGGDQARYDVEIRPDLVVRTIAEMQGEGVDPDVWKIEGLERREDAERVAAQARADGRDGVACVVLGRGANAAAVEHWLSVGATVPGFVGFAVGRTIWWDALGDLLSGAAERDEAVERIASNYSGMVDTFESARDG